MKRGLVVLDPQEVGDDEWSGRVRRLQERMAAEGVSVALVYGDVYRSDDIAYLTNLCIYWNEGMLAVPVDGDPVFLTKLSPRVHTWMRATSTVTDLRSGKAFGPLVTAFLEESGPGSVGLVDRALWPADLVAEVTAAADGREVRAFDDAVREQRLVPSPAELALLRLGAEALSAAFEEAGPDLGEQERIAVVEGRLRAAGYADVFASTATTGEGAVTLEVTGQFRQGWLHRAEPAGADGTPWAGPLAEALRAALGAVAGGVTRADLVAAAAPALGRLPEGVDAFVTCVNQADLATHGEYAGERPVPAGAVVAVGVELLFADGGRAAVAETVLAGAEGAEPLSGRKEASE